MRNILVSSTITFSLILLMLSCGGGKTQEKKTSTDSADAELVEFANINLIETHLGDNWNKIKDSDIPLSRAEYDSLKLNQLTFSANYDEFQYEKGTILIDEPNRKLLTIKAISSGEISEYLLGYINNNISDSLPVAYEDNVEYYSITSSTIKGDKITVIAVNYDYNGTEEISDTISTTYTITKGLTFEELFEE